MPKENTRTKRVADVIQRQLAQTIHREVNESRFGMISICHVVVSPDLSHAKVYISLIGEKVSENEVVAHLNKSAGYFRSILAKSLQLRIVPEIVFYFDDTMRRACELTNLIEKAVTSDREKNKS